MSRTCFFLYLLLPLRGPVFPGLGSIIVFSRESYIKTKSKVRKHGINTMDQCIHFVPQFDGACIIFSRGLRVEGPVVEGLVVVEGLAGCSV